MRVLIISSNRNKKPVPVMPYGACMIADAARRAGHEVRFLDLMFERDVAEALAFACKWKPDVAGISLRNIDNNDMYDPVVYTQELEPMINFIRSATQASIVIGGAACGVMPLPLLRSTKADYLIAGNGEESFIALLENIECNIRPGNIPGLAWNDGGSVRLAPVAFKPYTECVAPDFARWVDIRSYRAANVPAPLQSKRGCPLNCIYCTYSLCEGKEYRLASPESVVIAVERLLDQGFTDVDFVDSVFNAPYEHALEICAVLSKHFKGRARFHTMELSPHHLDDTLLSAMTDAGFSSVGITAESASDTVLRNLGKPYTVKEITEAAQCVRRHTLPCMWIFMLGGPGETAESVRETFTFAREQVRRSDSVFFNAGIRIYPGTVLEKIARREGVLTVPAEEMLNPVSYCSPGLNRTWLEAALRRQVLLHKNFIDPDSFNIPFLPALSKLASFLGIRYPLWKYTGQLRMLLGRIPGVST